MTPPSLAERLREKFAASEVFTINDIATEALAWFEEQMPGVEEVATLIFEAQRADETWDDRKHGECQAMARALLALIRERMKGATP